MVSFDICEGNPGCMSFLLRAYDEDPLNAEIAFSRMQRHGICGTNLYVLWNDCCDRNTTFALAVMRAATIEVLKAHLCADIRGIPFSDEEKAIILDRLL